MLIYHCPKTKQVVETGVETSDEMLKRLGQFKLALWCPHCQTGHQILACDTLILNRAVATTR
jgi:hypothetical protein